MTAINMPQAELAELDVTYHQPKISNLITPYTKPVTPDSAPLPPEAL